MQQAAQAFDPTAFFLQDRLVEAGPTDQLYTRPHDKRAEEYITGRFG
jgi:phosphate transport system ATP-binding protein